MTTNTTTFSVTGDQPIHCEGCEQRITRALNRLDGMTTVEVSAQSQRIVVEIDPTQTAPNQLRERLDLLGYKVIDEETA